MIGFTELKHMTNDDIRELLKSIEPDLATITSFWQASACETEYARLQALSEQEDFWKSPQRTTILQQLQHLKTQRDAYRALITNHQELLEMLTSFGQDEQVLKGLYEEAFDHRRKTVQLKLSLLLNEEHDRDNCFLSINAGAGGTESQDWAEMLLRMYLRFCEREGFTTAVLDYQSGEAAGIKSATIFIKGKNAYGILKSEQGVHRLVRISPFDANKRRHTSFAAALLIPEAPDVAIVINEEDLRIDTYRAGGAGGQHVNKTESAVRITHLPTGIVVQCQNERSQRQNKETALKMLAAKLKQLEEKRKQEQHAAIERKKIEWGSQIRSYVLHPYKLVKDHRTDFESPQPELVLDGELMGFIEAYLVKRPHL
jgi:peptide chain release factor 2